MRPAAVVLVVAAAVFGSVWIGVRWGSADDDGPVPAARTAAVSVTAGRLPDGGLPGATSTAPVAPAVTSTGAPPVAAADTTDVPADPEAWATVLRELYDRRAAAFTLGDIPALDGVYAPGSALRDTDAARLTELRAAGEHLMGFAPEVVGVSSADPVAGGYRVELTEEIPGYTVVTGPGDSEPAGDGPARPVVMTVVGTPAGWRIATAALVP